MSRYVPTGKKPGRPIRVDGPKIQPRLMWDDHKKLVELSELPEFKGNEAEVVRIALRELYKSRMNKS